MLDNLLPCTGNKSQNSLNFIQILCSKLEYKFTKNASVNIQLVTNFQQWKLSSINSDQNCIANFRSNATMFYFLPSHSEVTGAHWQYIGFFFGLLNRKWHLNKMTELNNVIHIKSTISQKIKQEWESKQSRTLKWWYFSTRFDGKDSTGVQLSHSILKCSSPSTVWSLVD